MLDRRELPITKNGNSFNVSIRKFFIKSLYAGHVYLVSFALVYGSSRRYTLAKSIVYPICKIPFPNYIASQPWLFHEYALL